MAADAQRQVTAGGLLRAKAAAIRRRAATVADPRTAADLHTAAGDRTAADMGGNIALDSFPAQ